jgi:hypothetical protein
MMRAVFPSLGTLTGFEMLDVACFDNILVKEWGVLTAFSGFLGSQKVGFIVCPGKERPASSLIENVRVFGEGMEKIHSMPFTVVIFSSRRGEKFPTKSIPFKSVFPSHGANYPGLLRKVVFVNVNECCQKIVNGNEFRIVPQEKVVTDEGKFWLLMMGLRIDKMFEKEIPKKYRNSKQKSGNFKSVFDEHYRSVVSALQQKGTECDNPSPEHDILRISTERARERYNALIAAGLPS